MGNELKMAAGQHIDLLPYFYGAEQGRVGFQIGAEQLRVHHQSGDGDNWVQFLLSKNLNAEQFRIQYGWIMRGWDTSPDLPTFYKTWTQTTSGEFVTGHAWFPRYAAPGTVFITNGWTQFFYKGFFISAEGTSTQDNHVPGEPKGERYYDSWRVTFLGKYDEMSPGPGYAMRKDVVKFKSEANINGNWVIQEVYYFQHGYGMIGWQKYASGILKVTAWWDNDRAEPRQLYTPPGGWPDIAAAAIHTTLPYYFANTSEPEPEPSPAPEVLSPVRPDLFKDDFAVADLIPYAEAIRHPENTAIWMEPGDLDPAVGLSADEILQAVVDGELAGILALCTGATVKNRGLSDFEWTKQAAANHPQLMVCVRHYSLFGDSHVHQFERTTWKRHKPGEMLMKMAQIKAQGWPSNVWHELELCEPDLDGRKETFIALCQWYLEVIRGNMVIGLPILLFSFGVGTYERAWLDDPVVKELTDLVKQRPDLFQMDGHEYSMGHGSMTLRKDYPAGVFVPEVARNPARWSATYERALDEHWHYGRHEWWDMPFVRTECWLDVMSDVQSIPVAKLEQAGWIVPPLNPAEKVDDYMRREFGMAEFHTNIRGYSTMRRYADRIFETTLSDDQFAAFVYIMMCHVLSTTKGRSRADFVFGANNDWHHGQDAGHDIARHLYRKFWALLARPSAKEGTMPTNEEHVNVQSKATQWTNVRSQPTTVSAVVGKLLAGTKYEAYLNYADDFGEANGEHWAAIRVKIGEAWLSGYVALDWIAWADVRHTQELPAVDPDPAPGEPEEGPEETPEQPEETPEEPAQPEEPEEPEETPETQPEEPEVPYKPTTPDLPMYGIEVRTRIFEMDDVQRAIVAYSNIEYGLRILDINFHHLTPQQAIEALQTAAAKNAAAMLEAQV
ncbi:hypothetical protein G4Y79_15360 [Phototrophicus methaneseepsis]|uniref:Uncharacterized protein n=1 Tax=Phototrophicus methaneseepsis TaxID=2710758 RepID=A0A7S8E655_9CHLR|nr:hypothetical protein [Phototrophicus methaneseepsis]QPC81081.1 hypothetical protein G4Y79_15360 [Phototrophicus methaneseepsis]